MKYGIYVFSEGEKYSLESNQEKFDKTKDSRDKIFYLKAIEEKFDIVAENYYQFERCISSISIRKCIVS